jgi:hypothetical protein
VIEAAEVVRRSWEVVRRSCALDARARRPSGGANRRQAIAKLCRRGIAGRLQGMTVRGSAVLLLAFLAACGSKDEPPMPTPLVLDAGPLPITPPAPGITELPTYDPASGAHLDGKEREAAPARPRNRNARMIGIMLRSTPPGAIAAVDGQPIGPTPTYWEGEFTGSEREFTFALAKHAVARYRFVPTTNGVVHGRLEPIADRPGAGTPAIPMPAYPPVGVGAAADRNAGAATGAPAPVPAAPDSAGPVTAPEGDPEPANGSAGASAPAVAPVAPVPTPVTPAAPSEAPAAATPAPAPAPASTPPPTAPKP